ncbi:transmembrane protein 192 [Platysternon megacephalum]|uniref:Transmembrane protein 192 n=1 Tax=Platysternon megacephalum TaxID=55544 RepID=A0A4D9DL45_9SAUR|nr:transmembrane protein 192 [Platysternon megacephalum]
MAEKLAPGDLFFRKARESVSSLDSDKLAPASPEGAGEESSDSEGEQEGSSHKLIRKVSTSGQMRSKVVNIVLCCFCPGGALENEMALC